MKIIAHRGNLTGPEPKYENGVFTISVALNRGFDIEIDVWKLPNTGGYRLGHDAPMMHQSVPQWFLEQPGVWCHAKDLYTLQHLQENPKINSFWQVDESVSLTWQKKFWLHSSCTEKHFSKSAVYCFLGERKDFKEEWKDQLYGICTDYPEQYKDLQDV